MEEGTILSKHEPDVSVYPREGGIVCESDLVTEG